jgi:hypothetical protein
LDERTAVLVRNNWTGQQELITKKQLFEPVANESHEIIIVRGKDCAEKKYQ